MGMAIYLNNMSIISKTSIGIRYKMQVKWSGQEFDCFIKSVLYADNGHGFSRFDPSLLFLRPLDADQILIELIPTTKAGDWISFSKKYHAQPIHDFHKSIDAFGVAVNPDNDRESVCFGGVTIRDIASNSNIVVKVKTIEFSLNAIATSAIISINVKKSNV